MSQRARNVVVIPNHDGGSLDFLDEWTELRCRDDVALVVVQDTGAAPAIPASWDGRDVEVFTRRDIKRILGGDAWIIPERTSACRAFGYWMAHEWDPEVILTLDTDCFPERHDYWLDGHRENLSCTVTLDWMSSTPEPWPVRGMPYTIRDMSPVMLSHGLWSHVPDFDAPTQLLHPEVRFKPATSAKLIPRFTFFPMCGMNLAWRAKITPLLWFGLHGLDAWGVDRFDDIWAGVLAKRVLDHLGFAAVSGMPSVRHSKQSNVFTNLRKEAPGMALNELLFRYVATAELRSQTVVGAYRELIEQLPDQLAAEPRPGYLRAFKQAALAWADLFA